MIRTLAAAGLTVAMAGAGLAGAGSAGAATQVCSPGSGFCIDSLTTSPAAVPNDRDVTVTVTVHVASGAPSCLSVGPPYGINAVGSEEAFPLTRAGATSATWSGSYVVRAFENRPGTYPWRSVESCDLDRIYLDEVPSAGLAAPLVVTGSNDTTAPVVRSLTITPASADATLKDVEFAVTARITDDYAGSTAPWLSAEPATAPDPAGALGQTTAIALTRTSGTPNDGTWQGTLKLAGGTSTTWSVSVDTHDRMHNDGRTTSADLAARGLASKVTTRSTAAPPTPTGVRASSGITLPYSNHFVVITGTAQASGKPMATAWRVTAPAGCGRQSSAVPGSVQIDGTSSNWKLCTFTVTAVNGAGSSKPVSVTAFI